MNVSNKKLKVEDSINIRNLNIIFTLCIVLAHSGDGGQLMPINNIDVSINDYINEIFSNLRLLAMSSFFFISGFLIFVNLDNFLFSDYKRIIKKRICTLIMPYIAWNIIYEFLPFQDHYSLKEFIERVFLFKAFPPDMSLWYCYALFVFILFSPVLFTLLKGKKGFVSLIILCFIPIWFTNINTGTIYEIKQWGYIGMMVAYMPYFIAGVYYGINYECINAKMIVPVIIVFYIFSKNNDVFTVICKCFIPILLIKYFPKFKEKQEIILSKLSNEAFLIYAIHVYFTGRLQRPLRTHILLKICPYVSFSNIIGRLVLLITVIFATRIFYRLISKTPPHFKNPYWWKMQTVL